MENNTAVENDAPVDALQRAIAIVGSQDKLAAHVGVSQPAISQWLNQIGQVPAEHVVKVSKATGWQVLPKELRPDLYNIKLEA